MTSIYLVRHGQASFGKKDYDNLSGIGEKQSFLLGEHFKKLKLILIKFMLELSKDKYKLLSKF